MQTTALHTRVSLRDIAQQLGLSHSTVSRALRNRPRVAHDLRQKIQQTAQQMGYRPDPMLSALAQYRQSKSNPEIGSAIGWINHWPVSRELRGYKEFDAYWAGAAVAAEKFGYRLEEFVCNKEIHVRRLEKILRTRNVNGILIPPHPLATDWEGFHWENHAAVRLGRSLVKPPLHQVASDQFANTVLAFEKIREHGYRRIGFLSGRASHKGGLFKAGFSMAQSDAEDELPALRPLYLRETDPVQDQQCFQQWMRQERPDAILTDVAATRRMLAQAGYRVPDDIGLAVLSILDGNADAGIYQNPEEIGRVAVLLAISLINDGARASRGSSATSWSPGNGWMEVPCPSVEPMLPLPGNLPAHPMLGRVRPRARPGGSRDGAHTSVPHFTPQRGLLGDAERAAFTWGRRQGE